MSDFGSRYMVDTNTLSQLSQSRRASRYFRENARIPHEVLHEAEGLPDIAELRRNEYPTTPSVLAQLMRVMATVPSDGTTLVNLYKNQGNADPQVVACALDALGKDDWGLFSPEWVVVSADKALRAKAEEFGLKVLSNSEFAARIDAAESEGRAGDNDA